MSWLDVLERRLRRFAVPHLTVGLIVCQLVPYVLAQAQPELLDRMALIPGKIIAGEWWRLLTFVIMPPFASLIWVLFTWYMFYLMGTALEHQWGDFRYNLFLLIGFIATMAASFLSFCIWPEADLPTTNAFVELSVFLAFAYLYPEFEIYIFFILPVKIKWLALLTWIGFGWVIVFGPWLQRLLILASVANFLLFFAPDILRKMRYGRRRMAAQASSFRDRDKPFHRCTVCGITDKTHPHMDFRYCSQCEGTHGYCMEHLHTHVHVTAAVTAEDAEKAQGSTLTDAEGQHG